MRARRLKSTLIDRIIFDDAAETLTVQFKNSGRYIYFGVPRAIYDALARAQSAGRFFNECIKGRYQSRPDPVRRSYRPAH